MIIVYALKSSSKDWIYVGMTNDLSRRMHQHNTGQNQSTKGFKPFELIHQEGYENRIEARKREKYLKSGEGKRYLYSLIEK